MNACMILDSRPSCGLNGMDYETCEFYVEDARCGGCEFREVLGWCLNVDAVAQAVREESGYLRKERRRKYETVD